jgi:hypothetical protein
MENERRQQLLVELADGIRQRQLLVPVRMLLDLVTPVGVIASQTALFVQPFVPVARWRDYLTALDHEHAWNDLRQVLNDNER